MIWAPIWIIALAGVAVFAFGVFLGRISAGGTK